MLTDLKFFQNRSGKKIYNKKPILSKGKNETHIGK